MYRHTNMHIQSIHIHTCTYHIYTCTRALVFHTPQYTYVVMCKLGTHKYTEHTHASVFLWTIIHLDVFVPKEAAPVIRHTQLFLAK